MSLARIQRQQQAEVPAGRRASAALPEADVT